MNKSQDDCEGRLIRVISIREPNMQCKQKKVYRKVTFLYHNKDLLKSFVSSLTLYH